jgi:PAS domain S-box-containing protein
MAIPARPHSSAAPPEVSAERPPVDGRLEVTLALLDTLLATAPVGFAFLDRDLRYVRINAYLAAINGLPPEQHLGRTVREVLPALAPALEPLLCRVIETGEAAVDQEVTGQAPAQSGERRRWLASYYPVRADRAADGPILGVGAVVREDTDRTWAAEAVRESEARTAAILETALDAIITIDHQGNVVEFNAAAERTFGYARTEVIGREMAALIMPERLREAHRRGLARYLATGEGPALGKRLEMTAMRADGTEFPVELAITRIPLDGPPLFTGYVRDITARKRAEETQRFLAEASKHLASSLDYDTTLERVARLAVPFLADWCYVALLDAGRFRVVAVAHVEAAKEALAWELLRRYPPNPDPTRAGGFSTALRTGQPFLDPEVSDARLVAHARDAHHLELLRALAGTSYVVAPLVARGQTLGVIVFFAAAARRRYGPDDLPLAEEVARRAAVAVDNARLYREAQEGIRVRDEFLSTAAHELKTPVAIAKGYAQVLRRRPPAALAPHQARALEVLDGQCDRLNRLVQDLLDVSRVRGGRLDLRRERCDLMELVAQVMERMQATTTTHRLRLRQHGPALVEVDRGRVEQVLFNLLSNAVKFSPQGGDIELDVAVREGEAVVAVQDQGVGIPRDRQARLFEQFYRAHTGTPHDYGGMGIGLHLSREIVTRHGGRMWFASEEGRGSTFSFSLPVAMASDG